LVSGGVRASGVFGVFEEHTAGTGRPVVASLQWWCLWRVRGVRGARSGGRYGGGRVPAVVAIFEWCGLVSPVGRGEVFFSPCRNGLEPVAVEC
jgi:hypothetical protein